MHFLLRPSLRRRKIRNRILLALLVAAVIAAGVIELSAGIRREINQAMMRSTGERAETTLRDTIDKLFAPVEGHLSIVKRWGERGTLDLADHRELNDRFVPMMDQFPWATSMMIADATGAEYMLLRTDSTWVTRSTDASNRPGRVEWRSWVDEDSLLHSWFEETGYDPRRRPWYIAAAEGRNVDERGISWTGPYAFFTTGQTGVTLSKKWQTGSGGAAIHVAGVDVPLGEILDFADSLMTVRSGYFFLMNRQDGIIAGEAREGGGLRDPTPFEAGVLEEWTRSGRPFEQPLQVALDGTRWWLDFRAVTNDSRQLVLAVTVPDSSFAGEVRGLQHRFALVAAGVFLLAMLLTVVITQMIPSRPGDETRDLSTAQSVRDLISGGEGDTVEFKSTLRWNINADKPGKEVEMSWLKTVVAYLNTGGGALLIGVSDDGETTGIEADRFPNTDKFLLHYNNLFKQHVGVEFARYVTTNVVPVGDVHVFVIQCSRAPDPAYLRQGKDERFYVRVGPSSRQLSTSEVVEWVRKNRG